MKKEIDVGILWDQIMRCTFYHYGDYTYPKREIRNYYDELIEKYDDMIIFRSFDYFLFNILKHE